MFFLSSLLRQTSKKTGRHVTNLWRYIMNEDGMIKYCENTTESILEEFLNNNTGPPGAKYRCCTNFRFSKVPQKVLIRKPWMVLLVNKPAGFAFEDCFKILKMVSINTFETFREFQYLQTLKIVYPFLYPKINCLCFIMFHFFWSNQLFALSL